MLKSTAQDLPHLATAREVADSTGIPLFRVYELARMGAMPVIRLGRAIRFDPNAVGDWFAAGGTAGQEGDQ